MAVCSFFVLCDFAQTVSLLCDYAQRSFIEADDQSGWQGHFVTRGAEPRRRQDGRAEGPTRKPLHLRGAGAGLFSDVQVSFQQRASASFDWYRYHRELEMDEGGIPQVRGHQYASRH